MGYISWSIVETKNFDHYMAEKFDKIWKNAKKHKIAGRELIIQDRAKPISDSWSAWNSPSNRSLTRKILIWFNSYFGVFLKSKGGGRKFFKESRKGGGGKIFNLRFFGILGSQKEIITPLPSYWKKHSLFLFLYSEFSPMCYICIRFTAANSIHIFLIINPFIRNQYSNFFRIKKPSTHVPSA